MNQSGCRLSDMTANRSGYNLGVGVTAEVRAEMARQRVSVSSLAAGLNIRRATLSAHLNGRSQLSFALAGDIAAFLGTTVTELTSRAEALAPVAAGSEGAGSAMEMSA